MKYIFYLTGLAFLFLITPACNKKLDVQPKNDLNADNIKTSADVEALLFGAYSGMQDAGAFGEGFIFAPDLLAADSQIQFRGTFTDYLALSTKSMVATNVIPQNIWGSAYSIINLCNTVLDKISLVDSNDRASVQGEALFMRGVCYYELVGLFAKPYSDGNAAANLGVPIILKPTYTYDSSATGANKPARSTVQQTYDQIINDLQAAIAILPTSNSDYRATVYSANAFLARAYLSMGDYANAAIQADNVIESQAFKLDATFDKAFNNANTSDEDLFDIEQTTQSNAGTTNNGLQTFYASYEKHGRGDVVIDNDYFSVFDDPNDTRSSFFYYGTGVSVDTSLFTSKWSTFYTAIPVVRLAEMYLTRGEANLMTGANLGASPLADINFVRARSAAASLASVSQQDFIEERFRELAFEGDRFWTLKRTNSDISGLDYDNDKLVLPIPLTEVETNHNLKQNPGYTQ